MPAPTKHNWSQISREIIRTVQKGGTMTQWCADHGMSLSQVSRALNERGISIKTLTEQSLIENGPMAVEILAATMTDPTTPPATKVSAATALLDRSGHSPQAVSIQIQNNNLSKTELQIPAFFATDNPETREKLNKLMGVVDEKS